MDFEISERVMMGARGGARDGAGRPRTRAVLEECLRLDIAQLRLHALVDGPPVKRLVTCHAVSRTPEATICIVGSRHRVSLHYTARGHPMRIDVPMRWAACTFGGERPWFECPACQRRCGTLFLGSFNFSCRECNQLAFASQALTKEQRTRRARNRYEQRLTTDGARPAGMHRRTYYSLRQRIQAYQTVIDTFEAMRLARMLRDAQALLARAKAIEERIEKKLAAMFPP